MFFLYKECFLKYKENTKNYKELQRMFFEYKENTKNVFLNISEYRKNIEMFFMFFYVFLMSVVVLFSFSDIEE